ncbi:MAG: DUF3073 family protein [Frankiales bacterium]|nr:DUF3073 family protein [Frankiales bacterium]
MGRGRAKAKQTKVARELKYGTVNTDLGALQAELSGHRDDLPSTPAQVVDDEDDDDLYSKYLEDDDED